MHADVIHIIYAYVTIMNKTRASNQYRFDFQAKKILCLFKHNASYLKKKIKNVYYAFEDPDMVAMLVRACAKR